METNEHQLSLHLRCAFLFVTNSRVRMLAQRSRFPKNNADALRLSRQAADTISIEKDTFSGPNFQIGLAQIEARVGAPEEAIKRLRRLLSIPTGWEVSIARLKIDPVWDPIRNRPDFQQLLSGPEQIWPNK